MYGYDWMFFAMQLAFNGIQVEETLEIEPVLHQSTTTDDFEVLQSLSEIRLVGEDDDPQGLDADEHTNLVNADLPQCRICLDTEGLFLS